MCSGEVRSPARLVGRTGNAQNGHSNAYFPSRCKLFQGGCWCPECCGIESQPVSGKKLREATVCFAVYDFHSVSHWKLLYSLYSILKCVGRFAASSNKNVRLALATVLLNTSSYLNTSGKFDDVIPELFLPIIGNMCGSGLFEVEAMVRVLVGFGTVLLVDDVFKRKAIELNMGSMLRHISSNHGDLANAVTTEILSILQ